MKPLFTLLVVMVLLPATLQAQFLKKLRQKAVNAVEKSVERRTEKEVQKSTDRALDTVVDAPKKKGKTNKNSEASGKGVNPFDIAGQPVTYEKAYTFPITVTMLVEEGNRKNKKSEMIQSYGKDAFAIQEPNSEQITIMDFNNKAALTLDTSKNEGQAISLQFMEKMMGDVDLSEANTDGTDITINKTGKSKIIAGYTADEYEIISEDSTSLIWFAKDVPFSFSEYMAGFAKFFGKQFKGTWDNSFWDTYGFMMMAEHFNKKGKLQSRMTTTNISEKEKTFDTSQYTIQKL